MEENKTKKTNNKASTSVAKKQKTEQNGFNAPHKLMLMFTVVRRSKCEFYLDLIQSFEVNASFSISARGTADNEILRQLGIEDNKYSVILSIIRQDKVKEAFEVLEEKFRTVRNGKGIAYTVPFSSVIGVSVYSFLANKTK